MTDIHPQDCVAVDTTTSLNDMINRKRFGKTLRSLRGYAGLSRRKLASRAGLSLFWVADLERGMAAPTEDFRAALERAIGCPLYYGKHQKVTVRVGEREAAIDVGIAPLIRELWVAGIGTINSCQQSTRGRIWVQFWSARDAEEFLDIVARCEQEDDLYCRMKARGTGQGTLPDWKYSVHVGHLALHKEIIDDCVEDCYDPPTTSNFKISLRIPAQDLPIVLQRLRDHNASHGKDRGKGNGI
jgi:transcriptional regulator with XRE-family HTH domain